MRVFAIAAIAGVTLAVAAGAALAAPWTDPAGRLTFNAPTGWTVQDQHQPSMTYIIVGDADFECHVMAIPRAESANSPPASVHRAGANAANFTPEVWTRLAADMTPVFNGGAVQVVSQTSETDGHYWPIQRAELQGPDRLVHAAVQLRPGIELRTYCQTYEGTDPTAIYDAFIRSVGTPNDAALQAQAEQADAAAPAPPAPAPAPAQDPHQHH